MACNKNHRYDPRFNALSFSEEFFNEPERWKCAGCAYEQGFNDARAGRPNNPRLDVLDQSQAGTVRHRNPIEAYNLGYSDGLIP